jgi:hypothetical protein
MHSCALGLYETEEETISARTKDEEACDNYQKVSFRGD